MEETLQALSAQLNMIAHQMHRADIAERLHEVGFEQQNNGISLAVLGILGSGKTTLINALLGREVVPTSTTFMPQSNTTITIAESSKATITFSSGEKKTVSLAPAALLNSAKSGSVDTLEIQYASSQWESGTRMMEVPDIKTSYQEGLTRNLAQANAVIYVADARQPLNKEEQALLTSIPTHITHCIIAFTKVDLIPVDEREAAFTSFSQQVEELYLPIKAQLYMVAPQLLLTEEYQPVLITAWEDFKQAILKIEPAPFVLSSSKTTQVNALRAITKDLQDALTSSTSQTVTPVLNTQPTTEHQKTYDLLKRIVMDQTNDIEETLKDSFNAFLFTLQDNLKNRRVSPSNIEEQANIWLDKEKARVETRFRRLYKTTLEDASRALGRELNFTPQIVSIPPIKYATAPAPEASPSFLANFSKEQRTMLIGGATVAVIGGLLSGPIGWTLLVVGTTGVAGVTLYVVAGQKYSGSGANPTYDKVELALPEGIEKNIRHNSQRLKDFLARAFQDANMPESTLKRDVRTLDSPFLGKLRDIQTALDSLSSAIVK